MKPRFLLATTLAIAIGVAGLASPAGHAQTSASVTVDSIDISAYPRVQFNTTVLGSDGKPMADLRAENLDILQGGMPVSGLQVSAQAPGAIDLVIAIDTSGSQADIDGSTGQPFVETSKGIARAIVAKLDQADHVGLSVFDNRPNPVIVGLTDDKGLLNSAIDDQRAFKERYTALYGGLLQALTAVNGGRGLGKAVVLLSDGEDEGNLSNARPEDVEAFARDHGIQVYTVFVGDPNSTNVKPTALWESIAVRTGGIRFDGNSPTTVQEIVDDIAAKLRFRYHVEYVSNAAPGADLTSTSLRLKGRDVAEATFNLCREQPQPVLWLPAVTPGRKISGDLQVEPFLICAGGRPISEVSYFLNDEKKLSAISPPFAYTLYTNKLHRTAYELRVEATLVDGARVVSGDVPFSVSGNVFNPAYLLLIFGLAAVLIVFCLAAVRRSARRVEPSVVQPINEVGLELRPAAPAVPSPMPPSAGSFIPQRPSAPAGNGAPRLRVISGPTEGQVYPMGASTTLGRSPQSDVLLAGSSVSREHARVWLDGASYRIRDLGSTNGTKVNGRKVSEATLEPGDHIEIPPYVLRFGG